MNEGTALLAETQSTTPAIETLSFELGPDIGHRGAHQLRDRPHLRVLDPKAEQVALFRLVGPVNEGAAGMQHDVVAEDLEIPLPERDVHGQFPGEGLEHVDGLLLGLGERRHAGQALGLLDMGRGPL